MSKNPQQTDTDSDPILDPPLPSRRRRAQEGEPSSEPPTKINSRSKILIDISALITLMTTVWKLSAANSQIQTLKENEKLAAASIETLKEKLAEDHTELMVLRAQISALAAKK